MRAFKGLFLPVVLIGSISCASGKPACTSFVNDSALPLESLRCVETVAANVSVFEGGNEGYEAAFRSHLERITPAIKLLVAGEPADATCTVVLAQAFVCPSCEKTRDVEWHVSIEVPAAGSGTIQLDGACPPGADPVAAAAEAFSRWYRSVYHSAPCGETPPN